MRPTPWLRPALLGPLCFLCTALVASPAAAASFPIGDTLTVIQRPLLNIPAFALPGDMLAISCAASPATTGWSAELRHGSLIAPLTILSATYDPTTLWWTLSARLPDSARTPRPAPCTCLPCFNAWHDCCPI